MELQKKREKKKKHQAHLLDKQDILNQLKHSYI